MVKVAVAGFGYWGPNLVRIFNNLENCELIACCDRDTARLIAVRERYPGIYVTTSYEEILESRDVDAVVIATPARSHYEMVHSALLSGKHVLVEKPLAMNSTGAEDLINVAKGAGLVLMVGHTFLYSPAVHVLKGIVQSGELGSITHLYSQRLNLGRVQTDINAMWSLAPHDVSIVLHLLNKDPVMVAATGGCYLTPGIEDVVFLTMTFPDGVIANVHVSWLDWSKVREFAVIGSRQMVEYDDMALDDKIRVYDKRAERSSNSAGPFHLHSGEIQVPNVPFTEPLANECGDFIRCIADGEWPISDGSNGLKVVRVLEAAQYSLKNHGAPVELVSGTGAPSLVIA